MPTKSTTAKTNGTAAKKSSPGASTSKSTKSKSSKKSSSSASSSSPLSLKKVFESLLNDTYDAELQLVEALPELAKAAYSEDLRDAFEEHLEVTKRQVERLERIYDRLGIEIGGETCEAMQGLVEESQQIISEFEESPVRDSALIIAAQKVEHYEIAAYGSLCELADVLGYQNAGDLLARTLNEEEETDEILTKIAMDVNDDAYAQGQEMEEEEEEGVEEEEEESYERR